MTKLELTWIGKDKRPKLIILSRCEWGHDDYSLNVANLPMGQIEHIGTPKKILAKKNQPAAIKQTSLFGEEPA